MVTQIEHNDYPQPTVSIESPIDSALLHIAEQTLARIAPSSTEHAAARRSFSHFIPEMPLHEIDAEISSNQHLAREINHVFHAYNQCQHASLLCEKKAQFNALCTQLIEKREEFSLPEYNPLLTMPSFDAIRAHLFRLQQSFDRRSAERICRKLHITRDDLRSCIEYLPFMTRSLEQLPPSLMHLSNLTQTYRAMLPFLRRNTHLRGIINRYVMACIARRIDRHPELREVFARVHIRTGIEACELLLHHSEKAMLDLPISHFTHINLKAILKCSLSVEKTLSFFASSAPSFLQAAAVCFLTPSYCEEEKRAFIAQLQATKPSYLLHLYLAQDFNVDLSSLTTPLAVLNAFFPHIEPNEAMLECAAHYLDTLTSPDINHSWASYRFLEAIYSCFPPDSEAKTDFLLQTLPFGDYFLITLDLEKVEPFLDAQTFDELASPLSTFFPKEEYSALLLEMPEPLQHFTYNAIRTALCTTLSESDRRLFSKCLSQEVFTRLFSPERSPIFHGDICQAASVYKELTSYNHLLAFPPHARIEPFLRLAKTYPHLAACKARELIDSLPPELTIQQFISEYTRHFEEDDGKAIIDALNHELGIRRAMTPDPILPKPLIRLKAIITYIQKQSRQLPADTRSFLFQHCGATINRLPPLEKSPFLQLLAHQTNSPPDEALCRVTENPLSCEVASSLRLYATFLHTETRPEEASPGETCLKKLTYLLREVEKQTYSDKERHTLAQVTLTYFHDLQRDQQDDIKQLAQRYTELERITGETLFDQGLQSIIAHELQTPRVFYLEGATTAEKLAQLKASTIELYPFFQAMQLEADETLSEEALCRELLALSTTLPPTVRNRLFEHIYHCHGGVSERPCFGEECFTENAISPLVKRAACMTRSELAHP